MADDDRDGMADLVFIKTAGTTGNVEVHMASAVSNYKTKLLDTTSPFTNETDGTWTMGDVDGDGIPDLVFVRTANSASQKVELHAAARGVTEPSAPSLMVARRACCRHGRSQSGPMAGQ
jgi:hypothetical protein